MDDPVAKVVDFENRQHDDFAALNLALSKARSAFPPIPRNKEVTVRTKSGASYTFAYAPLDTSLACITPALTQYGIALEQDIADGKVWTVLSLGLASKRLAPVPHGIKDGMGPQEVGSCLTYAQRYSMKVALVLATEEDEDGSVGASWTAAERPAARAAAVASDPEAAARLEALRERLVAIESLADLQTLWSEELTKEERIALAGVKEEVKTRLSAKSAALGGV